MENKICNFFSSLCGKFVLRKSFSMSKLLSLISFLHCHFEPHFSGQDTFQPHPLIPNPHSPEKCCVHFSQVCRYNHTLLDGRRGVNVTECSKWEEIMTNMVQKPFLVHSVSTIFVTYCRSVKQGQPV